MYNETIRLNDGSQWTICPPLCSCGVHVSWRIVG